MNKSLGVPQALDLLDDVVLGSARGGKRQAAPLSIEVVRALEPGDLELLENGPAIGAPSQGVLQIRAGHHRLAQCLAQGHKQELVALLTGYSPSYISIIQGDPAFAELLGYYQLQQEMIFADVGERMKVLGLHSLDELQARLTSEPDKWTKRELMDLAALMLKSGMQSVVGSAAGGGNGQGPGVTVNVKFVTAQAEGTESISPLDATDVQVVEEIR